MFPINRDVHSDTAKTISEANKKTLTNKDNEK